MSDLSDRAAEFWKASVRWALVTAKNSSQEQSRSESVVMQVGAALKELTREIQECRPSTIAELNAHIDSIAAQQPALVDSLEALRRAVGSTEVLDSNFCTELGSSVEAVRERLGVSCSRYLAALKEISREWYRFSSEAAAATSDKVASVQQELAELDVRKANIAGVANSNGARLIVEAENNYKRAIESINASPASTYASRPYQYWAILIGSAVGSVIASGVFGADTSGRIASALLLTGVAWFVLRWLDGSTQRAHAEQMASLTALAESARGEVIRCVSREQEEIVKREVERIGEDARRLHRKLDDAIGNLSEDRARAQLSARSRATQERSEFELTWNPLAAIITELTQLFRVRHAKAVEVSGQATRQRLHSGVRKCQAEIDAAVDHEIREPSSKCKVGSRDIPAPRELHPYLEGDQLIRVPWVVEMMESCYLTHDPSVDSVQAARRLASWHAMEIRRRTDTARVTIFDPAGLGAGYAEMLSIAVDEENVSLLTSVRDVSERLTDLVRTAATRNRALAASRERDWITHRTKTSSFSELDEVLVLEVPRAGFGSEQRAHIEALLGAGPSTGVTLIVLEARDRSEGRAMQSGMAREVELHGATAFEQGYSLDIPDKKELALKAKAILNTAAGNTPQFATLVTPAGVPSSNFAEFIGAVVPEASRWQSQIANTDESISIPVGVTDGGDVANLVFDDGAPHALLLGGTGSGKTNFLHTLIQAGCLKFSPDELRVYLADLKSGVSFEPYARRDGLGSHFGAVACTSSVVFGAVLIDAAKQEMRRRYDAFKKVQRRQGESIKGLAHYRRLANSSDETLPRLLVIIDEFQALFDDSARRRQTLEHLVGLLKQGRQVGVHVMLATQSLRGKAGDLDQALSQIHTRMILPAAMSDANSIFRSMSLAQQAVNYCSRPGKCFMSRDFGEKGGNGFTNPESEDNSFFFATLASLTKHSPPPEHLVPIVWSDEVGSLRDNYHFHSASGSETTWYLGVPYSAEHALVVPLASGVTTATVAVEDRGHARALVASLLMSLLRSSDSIDVFWLQLKEDAGPLRQRDFDSMASDLGLTEVKYSDSLRSLAKALATSDGDGRKRPQVAIVPDVTTLDGKRSASGNSWAGALTCGGESDVSSDIDRLLSIVSLSARSPLVVLLLASSCHDLVGGSAKSVTDLASIRIASGRLKGSRTRDFLRVSDLPEMADDDMVVTTTESRRPMTFRPFEERWNL